jgi:hypothetical protein
MSITVARSRISLLLGHRLSGIACADVRTVRYGSQSGPPAHVFWWARKHAIHSLTRGSASWLSRWQKLIYFFSSTAMFVQLSPIDFFMSLNRTSEKAR